MFPADLLTFTEEILNGKLHLMCSGSAYNLSFYYQKPRLPEYAFEIEAMPRRFSPRKLF